MRLKICLAAIMLATAVACAPTAPAPGPMTGGVAIVVHQADGSPVANAAIALMSRSVIGQPTPLHQLHGTTNSDGYVFLGVANLEMLYDLEVTADGCEDYTGPYTFHAANQDVPVTLTCAPPVVVLPRLVITGREASAGGKPFIWRFATGFRLADWVADGETAKAEAFAAWLEARGINGVRVLTVLCHSWFDLCAEDGRAALPTTLDLAARHGLYVEPVALTGTKDWTRDQMRDQVAAIGTICAAHPSCAGVELANENANTGANQSDLLMDGAFLRELVALVPAGVPVSSGSSCCGQPDEAPYVPELMLGTYLTVHPDRSRDTWERTRHLRELESLSADAGKYVVDDEGIGAAETDQGGRRSANPDEFFGLGAVCRIFGVGCTFHFEAGLNADVTQIGPVQTAAADAFVAGTRIVPDDVRLTFRNAGWTGPLEGPVKGFAGALRVFAGISDRVNVVVALGVEPDFRIEWNDGWRVVRTVGERPGVLVLEVAR